MGPEEKEICAYLKSLRGQFVSGKEIARRAGGKRRYAKNPNWAIVFLKHLQERKVIESDATGHYRLIIKDDKKNSHKKWMSPLVKSILEKSGKDFTHVVPDEYLDDAPPE